MIVRYFSVSSGLRQPGGRMSGVGPGVGEPQQESARLLQLNPVDTA